MQIAIILLIISFLGMIAMLERKLILIKKGKVSVEDNGNLNPFSRHIEKFKHVGRKNIKKYGYFALFAILRYYIRTVNYLKKGSIGLAKKIERLLVKNKTGLVDENGEKREISRHLKMISEYKAKIRHMKRKIREEEKEE